MPISSDRVISQLPPRDQPRELLVENQSVPDIVRAVLSKHVECEPSYDRICRNFQGGDLWETCEKLFDFCKGNIDYEIESKEDQEATSPQNLLRRGSGDCKGYALFIAGCLDALERAGLLDATWCYRFASYNFFDPSKGHVFVVVNKGYDDELWIDPVLDYLDDRYPWPIWLEDRVPYGHSAMASRVGSIGFVRRNTPMATMGSAESDLLSELLQYQQGVITAIHVSQQKGTLNTITTNVLQGASDALAVVPVLGALKAAGMLADDLFPPGSAAARIANDISNFNITGLFNDIFGGRTYNTDQYWGAAFYYWYVEGRDISNQNQVTDDMVIPALKWFIDRTGVFISGREHIMGLITGAQKYLSYASVNGDTTTDMSLVGPASAVAQQYWLLPTRSPSPDYAVFDPALKGTWRRTIGVFDGPLADIAHQLGLTLEQAGAAERSGVLTVPGSSTPSSLDPKLILVGAAILTGIYLLTSND